MDFINRKDNPVRAVAQRQHIPPVRHDMVGTVIGKVGNNDAFGVFLFHKLEIPHHGNGFSRALAANIKREPVFVEFAPVQVAFKEINEQPAEQIKPFVFDVWRAQIVHTQPQGVKMITE